MNKRSRGIRLTVFFSVAFIALMAGIFLYQHLPVSKKVDLNRFHGTYLEQARDISDFHLAGTDNLPFSQEQLKGQWTMLFFGFTSCGYVCPTTMAELGKMYRLLEEKHVHKLPEVVMISIDPKRDTLEKMKQYVSAFDKHFYGAVGDESAIEAMTRELGVVFAKVEMKDGENYDIQHSGAIMLFNPQGKLSAFFTGPHQANSLAEDYMQLVS